MSFIQPQEIENIVQTIESIQDCQSLNTYANLIIQRFITQINQALASASVFEQLITPPHDLGSAISWIENFIDLYLGGPYAKMIALETELLSYYIQIMRAFVSKLSLLSCLNQITLSFTTGSQLSGSILIGG